ncbi:MAG: ribonucleoside triphosphate reductase, partial [Candidatus Moranbacteria bacterium]|nr:ribonucleoside triphosphate reductase [Candidatus Moranbacteria bacterium]
LSIQDELQTLYTSGTVFHTFLGEKLPTWKSAANLVRKIAENHRLPYYTMSPTYSVCKKHGYLVGEHPKCPKCKGETEIYSRITGYYRPLKNWNDGKAQEFKERKLYSPKKAEKVVNQEQKVELKQSVKKTEVKLEQADKQQKIAQSLLFTTKTCPNCKAAKAILQKNHFDFQEVDAMSNVELAKKYSIKQAPTLLIVDDQGETQVHSNVSNIKKYLVS